MSNALEKVETSLEKVLCAVRTVKLLKEKHLQLRKITESTEKYANEIDKLNLPAELTEELNLLEKLKQELENVKSSLKKLSRQYYNLSSKIKELENLLSDKFRDSAIPPQGIREFCEQLNLINSLAENFQGSFEQFLNSLKNSLELAERLSNKLKQKCEEKKKAASSSENNGVAGTVGLAAVGTALGILGFFTGGAIWAAAGAVGATAFGVGAGAVAYNADVYATLLRQLANDIKGCSDKLGVIASELKNCFGEAIQLNEEMTAALRTLLEFVISDQRKDDRIAQLEREKNEREEEIAKLKEQLTRQDNN